jgi:hypothetical protein
VSLDRELLLLAFGSPPEQNAKFALEIMLDVLHEEADAFAQETTGSARGLALACRLEALKTFVEEYLTVSWTETAAKAAEAAE